MWVLLSLLLSINASSGAAPAACGASAACRCTPEELACRGLLSLESLPAAPTATRLTLRDCRLPALNLTQLHRLPHLRHLEAVNCSIQNLTGAWQHPHLRHVNLAANNLTTFTLHQLTSLPNLRSLNLSTNALRTLLGHPPVESRLRTLDLTGDRWDCTDQRLVWLAGWLRRQPQRALEGVRRTRCRERRKQYRTMDGRRLVDVMRLTEAMLARCPSEPPYGCSCDLVQVEGPPPGAEGAGGGPLTTVIVEVYCDSRGLAELPPHLPENTTALYVRNNSLTGFGPVLGNGSGYQTLTALYMDGNRLEAAAAGRLEGSDFIHRFSILSLANNRLQTLPLHAFDNAFQKRSFNVDSLFLGGNPWLCDCHSSFTFAFRTWLASQHGLIRDRSSIRCGSGPLAAGRPVLALSRPALCDRLTVNWWDVAIAGLVLALVGVVGKFVYDAVVYHRTGRLPRAVTKLPW